MGPILFICLVCTSIVVQAIDDCIEVDKSNITDLKYFTTAVIPAMEGTKGDAGKICIIGGSIQYTGSTYFAAISALKVGADLVLVITTEAAAPVIASFSPELAIFPFLHNKTFQKLRNVVNKVDVIVIGPGLGRETETMLVINVIIQTCKDLKKPLIIDSDGLYFISKNIFLLKDYPSPGVILTPNRSEEKKLRESLDAVGFNNDEWFKYWGDNITVLVTGEYDEFYSSYSELMWSQSEGGSGRRAGGQGDILSGSLGTFYNWALKADLCKNKFSSKIAASMASFAAAKFTRACNKNAFALYGRSMVATDMINQIHTSWKDLF